MSADENGAKKEVQKTWRLSSAGRASALQAECQQFDPVIAHQRKAVRMDCFFLFHRMRYNKTDRIYIGRDCIGQIIKEIT